MTGLEGSLWKEDIRISVNLAVIPVQELPSLGLVVRVPCVRADQHDWSVFKYAADRTSLVQRRPEKGG